PAYLCDESYIAHTGAWLTATSALMRARLAVDGTLRVVRAGSDLVLSWQDVGGALGYVVYAGAARAGPFTVPAGTAAAGRPVLRPPAPAGSVYYRATGNDDAGTGPP